MFKTRRYLKPRIEKAEKEFIHILDEATLLVEALILQQSGTNPERFKNLQIKKASIDSLNDVLITLKSAIKEKLYFIDDSIDDLREECLDVIKDDREFTQIIIHSMQLNLISDNNDISLYLAPYIESWDLLTAGVQAIILNHVIRSINAEIQRAQMQKKLSDKF
ncbi:MAG TPA: hypothetical protein VMZ29_10125 [Candidatus Bathyarchaeia archaeon]|nr:hypothetical protein [Candidatus Bathyarchaeia archaeon]